MMTSVAASSLDLRYDLHQDRLVLTARTVATGMDMYLTRRLTRALLSGLLDLLMRTSDLVARSGPDHRGDVLLFEHMDAVNRVTACNVSPSTVAPALAAQLQAQTPRLLDRIDVTITRGMVRLSFLVEAGEQAWLSLPRELVHQFVNMLLKKCQEAGWNLDELAWVDRRGQIVLPEGTRPC
ncbi:hypothetical protein GE253_04160 [Niveispirillum sp. SYP-B3756]|uniref:hypothetical protein n=1 Tax=Niveispirillum sp. SYP-B3756 TaxID=2662178 RepID=UPI0012912182|nr:hypothetical protein [Niveispirillum sp. SYP-B3756]MQP64534.1 hypothetical protein [Niveispirillum sp. SYP-B3756]